MRISRIQKVMAAALCVLLMSCGTHRYTAPTSAAELTRFVLVIEEAPDGRVGHHWRRAEESGLERYMMYGSSTHESSTHGVAGRIVLATSQQSDCYSQYLECYHQCRQTPVPSDFDHYLEDFGPRTGHDRYCSEKCMRQYTQCLKSQERRAQEFTEADSAVDWLVRNHKTVLVGSLIVISGVIFVTVSAGAGIVVLAPVALMTSSGVPDASHLAVVSP